MKTQEEIEELIQEKIYDIEYDNTKPKMDINYYDKNDAKIEVLEEILRMITDTV